MRTLAIILFVLTTAQASAAEKAKAPQEFVTQILEPTGGEIQRPKGWFYTEEHPLPSLYTWILSREDASKGPYTTAVRIEMIVGVHEGSGKTPKQFVLDYIKLKRNEAKVLETCRENNQGMFTRVCLETEEGPHHLLYSLFWANDIDIVVATIASTTKELWETYAPTFDRMMNRFELIDMKRYRSRGR
jgi:hypothetical protein